MPVTEKCHHLYRQEHIRQDRQTNVCYNYGSQEAGLVKHRLQKMNSIGIWYNIKHTDSFAVLEVSKGVVEEGLICFGS